MTMHTSLAAVLAAVALTGPPQQSAAPKAVRLELYSWVEAEKLLQPDTVVVLPLDTARDYTVQIVRSLARYGGGFESPPL